MFGDRKYQRMPPYLFSGVRGFFFSVADWTILSEGRPRLCDPFGIVSRQASVQWPGCDTVLYSCPSRYYRRRSFKHLELYLFSQS